MPDYAVEVDAPARRYRVTLTVDRPAPQQQLALPAWTPGSYVLRHHVRHLSALRANAPLRQTGTSSWVADCADGAPLVVDYTVHALDATLRGAWLDAERGCFDGAAMFLRADGHADTPHRLRIGALPAGWSATTAMPAVADGYADFIDHPVLLGTPWRGGFAAGGVEHEVAVSGAWPGFDGARLVADIARVCAAQLAFWGGGAPPFPRYVFLLHAADDSHGGLEHRASCALAVARRDLPRRAAADGGDGYANLLGLVSHEYFHAWCGKRLRPRELAAPDLQREQPTRLLWFFEGHVSYVDDLLVQRAGLVDEARYLRLLSKAVATVLATPGRHAQSVADASFDAWTRAYNPTPNTANVTVGYYAKGALVALLTDLRLRERGSSLDALMRLLWAESGGGIVDADTIGAAVERLGGVALRAAWQVWVDGRDELPLAEALATVGIRLRVDTPTLASRLGIRVAEGPVSGVQVRQVLDGGAGAAAGIAPGDELLGIDGWRVRRLDDARQWLQPDAPFALLLARDGRLLTLAVDPRAGAAVLPLAALEADTGADEAALARRRAWLAG